jgi:oligopeptide/dipeptide ABC transporter ATP-binding protein
MTTTEEVYKEPVKKIGDIVLDVRDLRTYLYTKWGITKAVDGLNFHVREGETLGIVGESGCGKSMTALSLLRLAPKPAARTVSGQILLDGEDILERSESDMRFIRGQKISMILQDPMTSLNPVYSVGNQMVEALGMYYQGEENKSLKGRAVDILRKMGVAAPERRIMDYPHQMSGGMKQRVVGAMAISGTPRVLICDEPTTALDVTIQAQYLRLLKQVQADTGVAIIFITHDMGVVAKMCDRVLVMYAGKIVETGELRSLFKNPSHPYTKALMASVPSMDHAHVEKLYSIEGQPPALFDLPVGCRFANRCEFAEPRCLEAYPPTYVADDGHTADCWLLEGEGQWKKAADTVA